MGEQEASTEQGAQAGSNTIPICESPAKWEKDEGVNHCRCCASEFNLLNRKHHCRACGRIFCSNCSSDRILVKGMGGPQRACFTCFASFVGLTPTEEAAVKALAREHKENVTLAILAIKRDGPTRTKGVFVISDTFLIALARGGAKRLCKKIHLLDLSLIQHTKPSVFTVQYGKLSKQPASIVIETYRAEEFVKVLRENHRTLTFGYPMEFSLQVEAPPERLLALEHRDAFPEVAGFILQYKAFCAYMKLPIAENLVYYAKQNYELHVPVLDLTMCPGGEPDSGLSFDLRPVFQALRHNTYFRVLVADNLNRKSLISEIAKMLRFNRELTRVKLTNMKTDLSALEGLGSSLAANLDTRLMHLDLSGCALNDRAVKSLAQAFAKFSHGFRTLILNGCSLGPRQLSMFIHEGLMKNYGLALTLHELDFSNNRFEEEGSAAFQSFLLKIAQLAPLKKLALEKTSTNLTLLMRPIMMLNHLETINLSQNRLDQASCQMFCSVLERSKSLKTVQLTGCGVRSSFVEAICGALVSNPHLHGIKLVLADNSFSEKGVARLEKCLARCGAIHTLDLSSTKLDEIGVLRVSKALRMCPDSGLDTLVLNDVGIRANAQQGTSIANTLLKLLKTHESVKSLSLAGGYPITVIQPFLEGLKQNQSLLDLDISNNKLGDVGASALSDFLRANTYLVSVKCDNNAIGYPGFQALGLWCMYWKALQFFEFPWNDFARTASSLTRNKQLVLHTLVLRIQATMKQNQVEKVVHPRFTDPSAHPSTSYGQSWELWEELVPLAPVPEELQNGSQELPVVAEVALASAATMAPIKLDKSDPGFTPPVPTNYTAASREKDYFASHSSPETPQPKNPTPMAPPPAPAPVKSVPPPAPQAPAVNAPPPPMASPAKVSQPPSPVAPVAKVQPPPSPVAPPSPVVKKPAPPPTEAAPPPPAPKAPPAPPAGGGPPPPPPPAGGPPPPPPGGGPPPPPPPGSAPPPPTQARTAMLSSIESFSKGKLKKAVTNDRSAPAVKVEAGGSGASDTKGSTKSGAGGAGVNPLFAAIAARRGAMES